MRIGKRHDLIIWLEQAPDKVYEIKEHRQRRTLTQNAYYWQLLTQVAGKMRISNTEAHNRMLRDYGDIWEVNGKSVAIWQPSEERIDSEMLRLETLHFMPTSELRSEAEGILQKWVLLKPSHEMNTQEMSRLVDGLVQEAKALEIETLTPRELEELRRYELQRQKSKSNRYPDESQKASLGA